VFWAAQRLFCEPIREVAAFAVEFACMVSRLGNGKQAQPGAVSETLSDRPRGTNHTAWVRLVQAAGRDAHRDFAIVPHAHIT
jgi:hypothetical protein